MTSESLDSVRSFALTIRRLPITVFCLFSRLSAHQNSEGIQYLLMSKFVLQFAKLPGWRYFLTGGKPWLALFWSPLGFCIACVLRKAQPFNTGYFRDEIQCIRSLDLREDNQRTFVLDFDNARFDVARCLDVYLTAI
jgi:hypothetical protein